MTDSINHVDIPESRQPSLQLRPRLPNECFVLIIQQLQDCRQELYILLTVSRFFFKEAIKLLYRDPFRTWRGLLTYGPCNRPIDPRYERLLALLLRSLLQRIIRARQQEWIQTQPQGASPLVIDPMSLLDEFGLGFQSLGFLSAVLLSEPTFVDYSVYLLALFDADDHILRLNRFSFRVGAVVSTDKSDQGDGILSETPTEKTDLTVRRFIRRINRVLLQFNYAHTVELRMLLHEFAYFIPFASRMPKLQTLDLDVCSVGFNIEEFFGYIITFIQQHSAAFPSKQPLDVKLPSRVLRKIDMVREGPVDRSIWMETRQHLRERTRPFIKLYETVKQPLKLIVDRAPWFYEDAHAVGTERLWSLTDLDAERLEAGEGPRMEAFLQRCAELRELNLAVGDPSLFRWATLSVNTNDVNINRGFVGAVPRWTPERPQQSVFAKLEVLKLGSDRHPRFLIHALNDAVDAFGGSLRDISVMVDTPRRKTIPAFWTKKRHIIAQELEQVPRATRLGFDWYLPNLRKMLLLLHGRVDFGSLGQCPLLEYLYITCRIAPAGQLMNVETTSSNFDNSDVREPLVFLPLWNLPNLSCLYLEGPVALEFNPESLKSMKNLKSLTLKTTEPGWEKRFLDLYKSVSPNAAPQVTSNPSQGSLPKDSTPGFRLWNWNSITLKILDLQGPIAMAFYLGQLSFFPALQKLHLVADRFNAYRLSISMDQVLETFYSNENLKQTMDQSAQTISPLRDPSPEPSHLITSFRYSSDKSSRGLSIHQIKPPAVRSRLRSFSLSGKWQSMETSLWVRILLEYVPHLHTLSASKEQDTMQFLRAIFEASQMTQYAEEKEEEKYCQLENTTNKAPPIQLVDPNLIVPQSPRTKRLMDDLTDVSYWGTLSLEGKEELDLQSISLTQKECCRGEGIRVFSSWKGEYLVRRKGARGS